MVSRRFILKSAVAGAAALAFPLYRSGRLEAKPSVATFENTLPIPSLLEGRMENGQRIFDLSLQRGRHEFFTGVETPSAGINGDYLGPVLRMRRGDRVRFNVTNNMSEDSTLHWHGVHLPAKMDGGPHQVIKPGETWKPEFAIRQPASTQWYHSHMFHRTGVQVYYGLAGLFYIDDDESDALGLPSDYGVDDIPLVLQDRAFNRDGSFSYLRSMHERMNGMRGDVMLVNGAPFPTHDVASRRMRLRLLNGSNARIYNLKFSDGRAMRQIASDGGLLEKPVTLRSLRLSPGERAEVIVEFSPGDAVVLQHEPLPQRRRRRGMMMGMMMMGGGDDQPFEIMRFTAKRPAKAKGDAPEHLVKVRSWNPAAAAKTRKMVLDMRMGPAMMSGNGFTINGKAMDMKRIDEKIRLGDVEIWEIRNDSPMPHPFHIHDIQFRILDRDGQHPPLNERGLKDTVLVESGETVRVITQFEDYADPKNPYMFHCHILEHEDGGMMGQFVVV